MRASNFTLEPFHVEHFDEIDLQPAQAYVREYMTAPYLAELARSGAAFTARADGHVLFCGGIREFGPERGILWTMVSSHAGAHFLRIHLGVRRFLQTETRPFVFATCQTGFEAGERWLDLLGFNFFKPIGPYGPARVPHDLYQLERA